MPSKNSQKLFDFFVHNGAVYHTGTILIINWNGKAKEVTFMWYDSKTDKIKFRFDDSGWSVLRPNDFYNSIIYITNRVDSSVHMPVVKTRKDWEIDGLFLGWIWYIFLMGISAIFKDALGLWLLISFVFFNWRSRKFKEEGTYLEW